MLWCPKKDSFMNSIHYWTDSLKPLKRTTIQIHHSFAKQHMGDISGDCDQVASDNTFLPIPESRCQHYLPTVGKKFNP